MNEKKQHEHDVIEKGGKPWIGVDLDGTLAEFYKWGDPIGKPVPKMVNRIYRWLAQGKTVKIFTARVSAGKEQVKAVTEWLEQLGLEDLEITNVKDLWMTELYDDKAVQIIINTGERADGKYARD